MAEVTFDATSAGGQAPSTGAAAYACTRLGLRVFPLVPGMGTPALKDYPDLATLDEKLVRDWWTGEYAGYGVGIACGPHSDLWVVDIDAKKGVDGYAAWARLLVGHGPILNTMIVVTPSGGAHVYFRWSEGVVNSTSRLGEGIDVRADRGYVRAPGWGGYDVLAMGGVRSTVRVSAPAWLSNLAQKRRVDEVSGRMREARPGTSWGRFEAGKTIEALRRAPEGTRNTALNKAAYKLGRWGELSEDEAWAVLAEVLKGMGAGDDMPAWRRTFTSGWNAGRASRMA